MKLARRRLPRVSYLFFGWHVFLVSFKTARMPWPTGFNRTLPFPLNYQLVLGPYPSAAAMPVVNITKALISHTKTSPSTIGNLDYGSRLPSIRVMVTRMRRMRRTPHLLSPLRQGAVKRRGPSLHRICSSSVIELWHGLYCIPRRRGRRQPNDDCEEYGFLFARYNDLQWWLVFCVTCLENLAGSFWWYTSFQRVVCKIMTGGYSQWSCFHFLEPSF